MCIMPFFIRGRGKNAGSNKPVKKKLVKRKQEKFLQENSYKKQKNEVNDVEITSEEDDEEFLEKIKNKQTLNIVADEETAQEKKVRLAKKYLEELRKQKIENEEDSIDEDEISKAVGVKLKEDVLEAAGVLRKSVADALLSPQPEDIKILKSKHHKLSLTCLVVSDDESMIFTASKDSNIVKWTLKGERKGLIPRLDNSKGTEAKGHASHILGLAISSSKQFLASGDRDGIIHIWNPENMTHLKTFRKHRGPISGLVFRRGTNTLFSASHDRLVMCWDLDSMAYAESLGGHQDCITSIDALNRESCITSGGRDEMVIVYLIPEEKQLRFSANQNSIDGVKLVNEKSFITFGQNGSLAFWTTIKKKPHHVIPLAHGKNGESGEANWITSAATLVNTDIVASGSMDDEIRLWKVNNDARKLEPLLSIPVEGVVNSLSFTSKGSYLLAAVAKEHKLGRWFTLKKAPNSLVIIPLKYKDSS